MIWEIRNYDWFYGANPTSVSNVLLVQNRPWRKENYSSRDLLYESFWPTIIQNLATSNLLPAENRQPWFPRGKIRREGSACSPAGPCVRSLRVINPCHAQSLRVWYTWDCGTSEAWFLERNFAKIHVKKMSPCGTLIRPKLIENKFSRTWDNSRQVRIKKLCKVKV